MAEIKRYRITEPYLDLHCALGEGPFWEESRNSLRFVDIVKKKLHTINLAEGPSSLKTFDLDYSIGCTADIEGNDEEFIFGGKTGYGLMDKNTGRTRMIKEMWTDAERQDDGGDDNAVVGSNFTDEGILFRLDSDLSLHRVIEGITIPNGTTWSKDSKTMYFTDSPTRTIKTYPFSPETGEMSINEGKVFFTVEGGVPDGHCQDEEGCLWVAGHGTWKVFRVNSQGQVIAEVELPTRCVTCPVLCGTELFITTMADVDPEKYPESLKYQGALFKVDVGVRGRPLNKFKMTVKA